MLNTRVLELLKNPKNILPEDLNLLREEINSFPYIQSIRALHLYGTHLYDKDNYQKNLSSTAAYTTDKKILYQLINGKPIHIPKIEVVEKPVENIDIKENTSEQSHLVEEDSKIEEKKTDVCTILPSDNNCSYGDGERNRILFEGEENLFLEKEIVISHEETELISEEIADEEQDEIVDVKDTNILLEDNFDENEESIPVEIVETIEFNDDFVPNEELIEIALDEVKDSEDENLVDVETEIDFYQSDKDEIVDSDILIEKVESNPEIEISENKFDDSEISFHATDSFLPEVKIESNIHEKIISPEHNSLNINKHEEEMRRLIQEVEKKMKQQKQELKVKEENKEDLNSNVDYSEKQSFLKPDDGISSGVEANNEEAPSEFTSAWKPMNLETHVPDSLIHINNKNESAPEVLVEKTEVVEDTVVNDVEESIEEATQNDFSEEKMAEVDDNEAPVMNFSFFGSEISSLEIKKEEKNEIVEDVDNKEVTNSTSQKNIIDSNVPGFINTWQSWLKIDRSQEIIKEKEEAKNKAIEVFIENNPKISQLKDEVTYVVKEKTDDISHLMTETLATLYVEQKLYSKAIKAFTTLMEKHPDRKDYFKEKIKEIKDSRSKN